MSDITFRRIKGHIVPIKKNEMSRLDRTGKIVGGTGVVVAGSALAAGAGKISERITRKSAKFKFKAEEYIKKVSSRKSAASVYDKFQEAFKNTKTSRQFGWIKGNATKIAKMEKAGQQAFKFTFRPDRIKKYTKIAETAALKSNLFKGVNKGLRLGILGLSIGIIGRGLGHAYNGIKGKPTNTTEEKIIANTAGATGVFAFSSSYARSKGIKNYFKFGAKVAKKSVKL